jgi:hypothetical protein
MSNLAASNAAFLILRGLGRRRILILTKSLAYDAVLGISISVLQPTKHVQVTHSRMTLPPTITDVRHKRAMP